VIKELEQACGSGDTVENFNDWAPDFLADYIVNQHHAYAKRVIPQLNAFTEKVARVHGGRQPETLEFAERWLEMNGDMVRHMQREELLLFPYIKQLISAKEEGARVECPPFGSIQEFIAELEDDHDNTGDALEAIERLSNRYTPPDDACNTYRALYASLEEFDGKTKEHVHLENNILFPKTIRMENSLPGKVAE